MKIHVTILRWSASIVVINVTGTLAVAQQDTAAAQDAAYKREVARLVRPMDLSLEINWTRVADLPKEARVLSVGISSSADIVKVYGFTPVLIAYPVGWPRPWQYVDYQWESQFWTIVATRTKDGRFIAKTTKVGSGNGRYPRDATHPQIFGQAEPKTNLTSSDGKRQARVEYDEKGAPKIIFDGVYHDPEMAVSHDEKNAVNVKFDRWYYDPEPTPRLEHPDGLGENISLHFSPDGRYFASAYQLVNFDAGLENPALSRIAYQAPVEGAIHIEGRQVGSFKVVSDVVFSPESNRLMFVTVRSNRVVLGTVMLP